MGFIIDGKRLIVPFGVTTIGFRDICPYFENGEIEEVYLPDSLTTIEDDTFFDLININRINIPQTVSRIGSQAFFGLDNLKELIVPKSVSYIDKHAFCNCSNLTLTIDGKREERREGWDKEYFANIKGVSFID